jgi:hypothetical protein
VTRTRTRLLAAAAALAVAGTGGCTRRGGKDEEMPPTPSARTPWVKARSSEGVPLLEAPATVLPSPEGSAGVVPPYRARVVRVLVRPGERVRKGQPLVEVVMPEVGAAAGAYAAATTRLEAYGKRKAQLEELKAEGLVRLADVLEADTKLAEARADQQAALATLRTAQVDAAEAAVIVSGSGQVTLRSPIAGMVVAVGAAVGDTREPTGDPLVKVSGEGDSRVEARFARAFEGAGARYELVGSNGVRYPMAFVARAPGVDPRDGTIAAWFQPPAGTSLPHGLSGRLVVTLDAARGAAVVPSRAVLLEGGQAYAIVRRGERAERVPVAVLASSGAEALVTGVGAGDEVAADAALAGGPEPHGEGGGAAVQGAERGERGAGAAPAAAAPDAGPAAPARGARP